MGAFFAQGPLLRSLVYELHDVRFNGSRVGGRQIAFHRDTSLVAQKLGKVPLQTFAKNAASPVVLQVLVQRMRLFAVVTLQLSHDIERDSAITNKRLDFSIGSRFLFAEIVARERQYG